MYVNKKYMYFVSSILKQNPWGRDRISLDGIGGWNEAGPEVEQLPFESTIDHTIAPLNID